MLLFRIIARMKYCGIYFNLHKGLGLFVNVSVYAIADLLGITQTQSCFCGGCAHVMLRNYSKWGLSFQVFCWLQLSEVLGT